MLVAASLAILQRSMVHILMHRSISRGSSQSLHEFRVLLHLVKEALRLWEINCLHLNSFARSHSRRDIGLRLFMNESEYV